MTEMPNTERRLVRVLLVEDDPGDVLLVEALLSGVEGGFIVNHASTLAAALEELARASFDVALLDLSLPDARGLETVERMRRVAADLPLVVLSGREDEEVALQALQTGAEDYLVKGREDGDLIARSIRYAIERKKAEGELIHLAQYDPLTGLANRTLFHDRLKQALARAGRKDALLAVLLVNLDRFKAVNDTLGQVAGDALLVEAARRMRGRAREVDTIARLGGDEFAIIIDDLSEARDVARVAQALLEALSEPFAFDGHEVPVTASVGIAVRPPSEGDRILKDADAAVNRAKKRGGNSHQYYTEEMNVRASERLILERNLRRAEHDGEFVLYYQPQVSLPTGRIVGAEALLRWRDPERGLVLPSEVVPLLEEIGLIVPVGEWTLAEACRQGRAWREAGLAPVRIAVNISARQLGDEGFVASVEEALEESNLDPSCLELEITESLLVEDEEAGLRRVETLKDALERLRITIDDFGTGYSSFYRLKTLPVARLKIDQSFIRGVATDPGDAAITAAVIALAHDLDLEVTAEGVETWEQVSFLCAHGCDEAQGFFFSRAIPAEEFARLLASRRRLLPAHDGKLRASGPGGQPW